MLESDLCPLCVIRVLCGFLHASKTNRRGRLVREQACVRHAHRTQREFASRDQGQRYSCFSSVIAAAHSVMVCRKDAGDRRRLAVYLAFIERSFFRGRVRSAG